METIKFRAFDEGTGEWLYFTLHDLIVGDASFNTRLRHWCQFTGIYDKKGKEIYVGDILKHQIGKSVYRNVVDNLFDNIIIYTYEDIDKMNEPEKYLEVIGNKYENPELMKGNKYGKL